MAAHVGVNLGVNLVLVWQHLHRRKLERLQKMIFSLQPRRAWTIDGFNSGQLSPGLSPPGPAL
jgi:hypothetical protein